MEGWKVPIYLGVINLIFITTKKKWYLPKNNGRKADRDLVQFVPYKDFKNDGQKFAEQVLEEVPRQIVEFYQHKKISPGDPIVNIQSSLNNK